MRPCRASFRFWLVGSILTLFFAVGFTQTQMAFSPPSPEDLQNSQTIAPHKQAVKSRLEELAKSQLSEEELAAARNQLGKLLTALTALEEGLKRRDAFIAKRQGLPERLHQLSSQREQLEKRPPQRFSTVTDTLLDGYEKQRAELQKQLETLSSQSAADNVRLAHIPQELEQRAQLREQVERDLQKAKNQSPTSPDAESLLWSTALLTVQLQVQRVEQEALQAERDWLTKRGPLQDALLSVTRLRLQYTRQDLDAIQLQLGVKIQREHDSLSAEAEQLRSRLIMTDEPAEKRRLAVRLETIAIRQMTVDYRHQLNGLDDRLEIDETRNFRLKQDTERLVSLVEKHKNGERVAQRLLVSFDRISRERRRFSTDLMEDLKKQLGLQTTAVAPDATHVLQDWERALNDALFDLENRLYEFDRRAASVTASLSTVVSALSTQKQQTEISQLRQDLEAQRVALREQQQVLTALVHKVSRLMTLHQDYIRRLEDNYRLILGKIFWVRDGEAVTVEMLPDIVASIDTTAARLDTFVRASWSQLWPIRSHALPRWMLAALLLLVIPWLAYWGRMRLQRLAASALHDANRSQAPSAILTFVYTALQAAVWPMYLAFMGWFYTLFSTSINYQTDLVLALASGCYVSALVLWMVFFSRALLNPQGWGARFWRLTPQMSRFLRRTILLGFSAALVLLVPRQMVMAATNGASSEPLARLLLLVFQGVLFIILLIAGRRSGPLMSILLQYSHEHRGFFWHIWPFVHLILLCGVLGVIGLEMLGYQYAARFIWHTALQSLSILVGLRLLLLALVIQLVRKMRRSVFSADSQPAPEDTEDEEDGPDVIVHTVWQALLVIAGLGFVLELWGVSVTWLLTTTVGQKVVNHAVVIVVSSGLAVFVIQLANVFFDYLVHPRMSVQGNARETGRKLRMLAPLIQAVFKVGVCFVAAVVMLRELGMSTSAMLASLGVVGVAIGLASQSVIKDIINGLFILFEDSLSVGDLVALDGIRGFVEKITLRAVTIRDLQGVVHLIPNNTIGIVSNETKEFSCYMLDLQVDCDEDVDVVLDILREVDEEMRQDPVFADGLLAPADMLGLERFEGDVVVMRVRLTTQPHRHLEIGREYNRRIKNTFDAKGIQLPSPGYKIALRPSGTNHQASSSRPASVLPDHFLVREQQRP